MLEVVETTVVGEAAEEGAEVVEGAEGIEGVVASTAG